MNNRVTSDSGNSVSLFPFLAVLLCTMGALLVLLVVLAQRAGQRAVADATQIAVPVEVPVRPPSTPPADSDETAQLVEQLEQVGEYRQHLAELGKQADQRLREEQQRLTHLEGHTRRLEHELARLSLAAEQLKATEQNQSVDQAQAERELARLQQLIKDTEADLETLRGQGQGQRSYAIVPYRGPNGTYRKPIYIECRGDAIVLHPEGIRLKASDFAVTSWAGNPLAAALRATRDHVNAQAAIAGAPEPPDPYPMILVRPDGIRQYSLARAAIKSWDAHYGYEFIDDDWELSFPELPDPQLARVQQHAIMLSRERLVRLIRSAPSRFGGMGAKGNGGRGRGDNSSSAGFGGDGVTGEFGGGAQGGALQAGSAESSNDFAGEPSGSDRATAGEGSAASGGGQTGGLTAEQSADGASEAAGEFGEGTVASSANQFADATGQGGVGDRYSQASGSGSAGAASDGRSAAAGSAQSSGGQARPGGAAAANRSNSAAGRGSAAGGQAASIADSQGRNWAVQGGGPTAVAIRRPIQLMVRDDELALLPSRHAVDGVAAKGTVISLSQSQTEIARQFVAAFRNRVEEWGLAGNGLYWRPVLKLNIGPGAEQSASHVLRLLNNSGIEVSLPDTARAPQRGNLEGRTDATR